ncbi:hypothetical protein NEHOM01_0123 [Nematocida homosporus]|uniref:uncharacterized protein n=1 Tax=Nematocida homosporus TaxID=1912981 RepID=UPI00221F832B|nr:uncharacterized protein NEHOM01_0123 [Nematocida homosporus]KAI5184378.1 hypothetical protein NEHOM01_0123 [Nematocida homosporus]
MPEEKAPTVLNPPESTTTLPPTIEKPDTKPEPNKPAEPAPAPSTNQPKPVPVAHLTKTLSQKEGMKRKKVKLGEKDYYVVTLEEVERYKDLQPKYKSDAMSAYILYMHTEFIDDLLRLRNPSKLKSLAHGVGIFIVVLVILGILGLIAYALLSGYFSK